MAGEEAAARLGVPRLSVNGKFAALDVAAEGDLGPRRLPLDVDNRLAQALRKAASST